MGAARLTPSDATLARWREEGLTVPQMVARHLDQTGIVVKTGTMYAALSRAGLTERRRYDDLIPWKVADKHSGAMQLAMLRLAARASRREVIPLQRAQKMVRWVERLRKRGEVVHYNERGFHYVKARPDIDTGLIRVPNAGGTA